MPRRVSGVLAVENTQTGDGRVIAGGALTWADLPLPLAWLREEQHDSGGPGAVQVGTIDQITRDGDQVRFVGTIDDGQPDGAEAIRRMEAGTAPFGERFGVSIDPDDYELQVVVTDPAETEDEVIIVASGSGMPARITAAAGDADPGDGDDVEVVFEDAVDTVLQRFTRLRIRGATLCAVPAFADAFVELDGAAAAEGEEPEPDDEVVEPATVAASGAPIRPPATWFRLPEPQPGQTGMVDTYGMPVEELLVEQPDGGLAVPLTITDDGRVFGHAARWGQCHIGYPGACVTPPESMAAYSHFHHGEVVCDDGSRVATGVLTVGADHAPPDMAAAAAADHYANSALGWADVRATNGELGVWVSGVLRPDVSDGQLRVLRSLSLSGDWRRLGGNLEFIAALAVNVPGFPIAREAILASGLAVVPAAQPAPRTHMAEGGQVSLIAAGVVARCSECVERVREADRLRAELASIDGALEALGELRQGLSVLERRTRHLVSTESAELAQRIHVAEAAAQAAPGERLHRFNARR